MRLLSGTDPGRGKGGGLLARREKILLIIIIKSKYYLLLLLFINATFRLIHVIILFVLFLQARAGDESLVVMYCVIGAAPNM